MGLEIAENQEKNEMLYQEGERNKRKYDKIIVLIHYERVISIHYIQETRNKNITIMNSISPQLKQNNKLGREKNKNISSKHNKLIVEIPISNTPPQYGKQMI